VAALERWSPSAALLARRVPEVTIVPTLITGVISDAARRSPLTWFYTDPAQREWVAATLQIALPAYRQTDVEIIFGRRLHLPDASREAIMQSVTTSMEGLIRRYGACYTQGDV
jgi:hypothetical protein